ncbi:unnamed protein product [Ixodes persulcatus]
MLNRTCRKCQTSESFFVNGVSKQTVRHSVHPCERRFICMKRLQFAQQYGNGTLSDWQKVALFG